MFKLLILLSTLAILPTGQRMRVACKISTLSKTGVEKKLEFYFKSVSNYTCSVTLGKSLISLSFSFLLYKRNHKT